MSFQKVFICSFDLKLKIKTQSLNDQLHWGLIIKRTSLFKMSLFVSASLRNRSN